MTNGRQRSEEYGEFKGATETTLKIILTEIKGLRDDVDALKGFKAWSLGIGAAAGFMAAFVKETLLKKL